MSRFASLAKTERWYLPDGCQCPGEPHSEGDWILMRTELGGDDMAALVELNNVGAVTYLAEDWNLLDDEGKAVELTRDSVGMLFADVFDAFELWSAGRPAKAAVLASDGTVLEPAQEAIEGHVRVVTAPNGSGGRSGTGTPATAPRNRAERRARRSSTS